MKSWLFSIPAKLYLVALLAFACRTVPVDDNVEGEVIFPLTEISGKVLCGYQGWFNAEGDGANLGWKHYANKGKFEPGHCSIDYWPDMSEYSESDRFDTPFVHGDGSSAQVFSSARPETVDVHFRWMQEYGIDGVFVQRFVNSSRNETRHENYHQVFDNCYKASLKHERIISVMYDLSGSDEGVIVPQTKKDWKVLVDRYALNDPRKSNLMTHEGKPLVSIWGVGFKDRDYRMSEIQELIEFFKNDPVYGGCAVLLGVPTGWRELNRDCIADPAVHDLIEMADVVHPWTPGRYRTVAEANTHRTTYTVPDKAWCDQRGLTYMPVVFPGFSWFNLKGGAEDFDRIPRLEGDFFWSQLYNGISSDVETMYVAMFDEIDEGTAIFKVSDDPPVGESPFLTYDELPSDYYLWMTGAATRMLRGELPQQSTKPAYGN